MKRAAVLAAALLLALTLLPGVPPAHSAAATALPPMDVGSHFRIMPLGDSITSGTGSSAGDGYRWYLAKYLVSVGRFTQATYVGSQSGGAEPNPRHEGHSGWTIEQLTAPAPGWITTYNPDLVYLHAGVNDARAGATVEVMSARMTALLDAILNASPTVRIMVGDLMPPWNNSTNDLASMAVQRFNEQLPAIVAAAGPRVTLARMSLAVPGVQLTDGLHPADPGYERMAWVWWRCTAPLLAADGIVRYGKDPLSVPVAPSVLCPAPA